MKIIYSSNFKAILGYKPNNLDKKIRLIVSNSDHQLQELTQVKRLKYTFVESITGEEQLACEKEYIANIAGLADNFDNWRWWANPVSEKNEHLGQEYKDLCEAFLLIKTTDNHLCQSEDIFVYGNPNIFVILKEYYLAKGIPVVGLNMYWLKDFVSFCCQLIKVMAFIFKVILRKLFLEMKKGKFNCQIKDKNYDYIIRTWLYYRPETDFKADVFFGDLIGHMFNKHKKVLLLSGILDNYSKTINKINDYQGELTVVPEEYFLKYSDIFKLFCHFQFRVSRFKEKISFKGIDVSAYYSKQILKNFWQAPYFNNIVHYLIGKNFAKKVDFKVFIQTFENYSWEKVTIKAIRQGKPNAKILGFQHAFISRNSFKYFPGDREILKMPLPDKIITMGRRTKEILEKYGAYGSQQIEQGCALRQQYFKKSLPVVHRNIEKILVPLTMVASESVKIIRFVYQSELIKTNKKIIIRPHPACCFDRVAQQLDFKVYDNFIVDNSRPVGEQLMEIDLVIYTWSTIAAEALRLCLPVVYLDILKPFYVDPLFECLALKRQVSQPGELTGVINDFDQMVNRDFQQEQQQAQEYIKDYFNPVTEKNLEPFFV